MCLSFLIPLLLFSIPIKAHSDDARNGPLRYYELVTPSVTFFQQPKKGIPPSLSRRHYTIPEQFDHETRSRLSFSAFNQTFHLYLEPSTHIIHPHALYATQRGDDEWVTQALKKEDYLVYHGSVMDEAMLSSHPKDDLIGLEPFDPPGRGWASVMVRESEGGLNQPIFQGVFSFKGDTYNFQTPSHFMNIRKSDDPIIPKSTVRRRTDMSASTVIYRSSDLHQNLPSSSNLSDPIGTCGNSLERINKSQTDPHTSQLFQKLSSGSLFRRQFSECNTKKKFLYMGVAADCNYVAKYSSADEARRQIILEWNSVSKLYEEEFNVKIGIIKIEIPTTSCPATVDPAVAWNRQCDKSYDMKSRLNDFSLWRDKRGADSAGLWHLVTTCTSGSQVGLAWVATLCQSSVIKGAGGSISQPSTGAGASAVTKETWKVIAHEIGHNFGATHDCTSRECPCTSTTCADCCPCTDCDCGAKYIMNPESTPGGLTFSPCSRKAICGQINEAGSCLALSDSIPTYTESMCGNGIREKGEDCDCGGEVGCGANPCCEAKTCKFKAGAKCDDANDGCCKNCQIKPANTTCRAKAGSCDLEEKCDGVLGTCPPDSFVDNGTPCTHKNQQLKCANGICTSRDLQCQVRTQGYGITLTEVCKITTGDACALTCSSPSSSGNCYRLAGEFSEGTECGRNAYCVKGSCVGGSAWDNIMTWVDENKLIAIGLGVLIGFFILSCLGSCLCGGARRYKSHRQPITDRDSWGPQPGVPANNPPRYTPEFVDPTGFNGPTSSPGYTMAPHPQPMITSNSMPQHNPGFVDPAAFNGPAPEAHGSNIPQHNPTFVDPAGFNGSVPLPPPPPPHAPTVPPAP